MRGVIAEGAWRGKGEAVPIKLSLSSPLNRVSNHKASISRADSKVLIQNYGLFWRADRVEWGAGRRKGKMHGFWSKSQWCEVDFREQIGVYVLYDTNFKIVYVGQAGFRNQRLFSRLKQHRCDHLAERWSRFSWFGTLPVWGSDKEGWYLGEQEIAPKLEDVLNHIEGILIAATEPPLNKQGGRFGDAEFYLQSKPEQEDE